MSSGRLLKYVIVVVCLGWAVQGTTQEVVPDRVMDYLKSRPFPRLIEQYGARTVQLELPSRRTRHLDSLPYRIEQGYRVQVIATKNPDVARTVFQKVQALALDSTYLIKETGLFKVQVGNFTQRDSARTLLDRLYYAGFKDAWITPATIHLPKPPPVSSKPVVYYAIQLLAVRQQADARRWQQQLARELTWPVWVVQRDHLWKVLVGKFPDEVAAREVLAQIRQKGWKEAWLTQVWAN